MVKFLNTAFINITAGGRGELFNPDCPFSNPDEAYEVWINQRNPKNCVSETETPFLKLDFAPGCYNLKLKNYSKVVFIDCCASDDPSKSQVSLIIDRRKVSSQFTFSDVVFEGVKVIEVINNESTTPPVFAGVRFLGSSQLLFTSTPPCCNYQPEPECKRNGNSHHCKDCEANRTNRCSSCDKNTRKDRTEINTENRLNLVENPIKSNSGGLLSSLSTGSSGFENNVNYQYSPPFPQEKGKSDLDVAPVRSIREVPGAIIGIQYGVTNLSRLNIVPVPIVNVSTNTPLIVFQNVDTDLIVNIRSENLLQGNTRAAVFVANAGSGTVLLRPDPSSQSSFHPRLILPELVYSSLIETTNTNITIENLIIEATIGAPVLNSSITNAMSTNFTKNPQTVPSYLIKYIPAITNVAPQTLIRVYNTSISLAANIDVALYLTNTIYYTATDFVNYNVRLYNVNRVGPLFAIQNGNSLTWNGATVQVPIFIGEEGLSISPFYGTIFYIDSRRRANNVNSLTYSSSHRKCIQINLPNDGFSNGRILEFKRLDDEDCVSVLIVSGGSCKQEFSIESGEYIKIQNIGERYVILFRIAGESENRRSRESNDQEKLVGKPSIYPVKLNK